MNDIKVVPSRFNLFWFEVVTLHKGVVVESHGQFRSVEQAETYKNTIV